MHTAGPKRAGSRVPKPGAVRLALTLLLLLGASSAGVAQSAARPTRTNSVPRTTPADAATPRLLAAELALARGEPAKALALAEQVIAAGPRSTAPRLLAARARLELGELDAAWSELDRVLDLAPRDVEALALMGHVSGLLAAAAFDRLESEAPRSARVAQLNAEALEAQDRRADAEAAYEAALAVDPNLLEALLALGRLKRLRLACDEAIALYERAEKIRSTFDSAYGLGFCLAYMQQDEAAAVRYEQAVKRDPRAAVAWSGLGTALVKIGRTAEGIAALNRALTIEPKMTEGWYMLGMAYQATGDAVRAKEMFAKADQLRTGARP